MKKKLLSLVLAGAMVASTSVSAFADTASNEKYEANGGTTYNFTDEKETNIGIEGNIADSSNEVKPSTISVTVPTTAQFTVNSDGTLIGSNINITSQSDTAVQVIAYRFVDLSGESDINAVDIDTLNSENQNSDRADRKKVYLKLTGDEGAVSLQSNAGNTGICELDGSDEVQNKVLGTVKNGKNLKLSLDGSAVTVGNKLTKPLSDNFTLTLKLKKVNS